MAPELLKGDKPSMSPDLYALGAILCCLAIGRQPFSAETAWEDRLVRRPPPVKHRSGTAEEVEVWDSTFAALEESVGSR
jgi:serine/threonine protein kinase